MSTREIVEAVKVEYPKFSSAALSLASRSYDTGVTFVPRAREIVEAVQRATSPTRARKPFRRKSVEFKCRLAPANAQAVKNEMTRRGVVTVRDLLEALLLEWAEWSKKEPLPVVRPENGSEVGAGADASPASKSITNVNGGQHGKTH